GLLDWDAIEDRGRRPRRQSQWDNISDLVDSAVRAYRLPRWEGQRCYVELWVEKEALAGVLEPLASEFHVTLMVNKGYSSSSAMFDSAQRFKEAQDNDKQLLLFYLGDHDPSGEDMVRDIRERMRMFEVDYLTVTKLALTWDQIQKYNPPPNPAKLSDSRAKAYIAKHGTSSWEVDALPPNVLQQIIRDAFKAEIDESLVKAIKAKEARDKQRLREAAAKIMQT